ncbi:hypothetical protein NHQ30_002512 [Ciborinia camelliae]|nr:hypothetical protein NHQ30_002512 [Ciborinia camelliae]
MMFGDLEEVDFHVKSRVIFVDGACRGNGQEGARAAFGVYFGDKAPDNDSGFVDRHLPQTNQVAELFAAIMALDTVMKDLDKDIKNRVVGTQGRQLCSILIITDSAYVVDGISEWIYKWKVNGFKTSTGNPVTNAKLFEELDYRVDRFNRYDVPVWFWHVKREFNQSADAMARVPLYGEQEIPAVIPFATGRKR